MFAIIVALGTAGAAFADETEGPSNDPAAIKTSLSKQPDVVQDYLLLKLKERGITPAFKYRGEAFYNSRLYPSDATRYRGLVDLSLTFNTKKLGLWPDGEFFIEGQNGHGQNITVSPGGVVQPISNIEARDFTQISEYGLSQSFPNHNLRLRLGRQDVNKIFCVNGFGPQLINPSYALIPTVPMPTFPAPALGAAIFGQPAKWFSLGVGFYDGGPKVGTLGFDTAFEGKGGYFSVFEPAWRPSLGVGGRYPGNYRIGLWYHSGKFVETSPSQHPGELSGNYGFYLIIDQLVYKEPSATKNNRGLGVFLQFGWAPSDRNQVSRYVGAGCSYKGFLPARQEDTMGFGVSSTRLIGNQPTAGQKTQITNVEFFYDFQLTPWMNLRPDIQYFDHPDGNRKNGLAVGLRWIIQF